MSRTRRYGIGDDFNIVELFYMLVVIVVAVAVVGAFVIQVIVRPINKVCNIRTVKGTVTEKTVKRSGKSGDKYLVFIEEESGKIDALEVTDSLWRWRFDSTDVYAGIGEGEKYTFEVGGSRVPILSWYPNIYGYEEIE